MKNFNVGLLLGITSISVIGCGSGNNNSQTVANVIPVSLESPLVNTGYNDNGNAINVPYVSLSICQPNTNNCVTLDHVLLDTGSTGLRVVSSLVDKLNLQPLNINGSQINECITFGTGYTWGPVARADIRLGGQTARNIPINLLGGSNISVPNACSEYAMPPYESSVETFGSNAIIGVNPSIFDTGNIYADPDINAGGGYYTCNANDESGTTSCSYYYLSESQQVANPIAFLTDENGVALNNNGLILSLPAVNSAAANEVTGSLTFGINTQVNNVLNKNAPILQGTLQFGNPIVTIGSNYAESNWTALFDSGTQGYLITNNGNLLCAPDTETNPTGPYAGLLCPIQPLNLTANITSYNFVGDSVANAFKITNALTWINDFPNAHVYPNLGYYMPGNDNVASGIFIWGLPFFLGKDVYLGFTQRTVDGVESSPFNSFTEQN
jgi:hypothetical protein